MQSQWGGSKVKVVPKRASDTETPCVVCQDMIPNVRMQPCSHLLCNLCVHTMRQQVVHKASKGFDCPLCRSIVHEFEPIDPTDMGLLESLKDANAAALRLNSAPKVQEPMAPRSALPATWKCPACGNKTTNAADECSGCGREREVPRNQPKHANPLDINNCSVDDIYQACMLRFHFAINHVFQNAGIRVVIDQGKLTMERDVPNMLAATRSKHHATLKRMVSMLQSRYYELSCNVIGAYSSQDILTGAFMMRQTGREVASTHPAESAALLGPPGTQDSVARLVDALAPHAKSLASHRYGNFSLQRAIELGDASECLRLAAPVLKEVWLVYEMGGGTAAHVKHRNPAAFVVQAAVHRVAAIMYEAPDYRAQATELLHTTCAALHAHIDKWSTLLAMEGDWARMVVTCVQGALPQPSALELLLALTEPSVVTTCLSSSLGLMALGGIAGIHCDAEEASTYLLAAASNICAVVQDSFSYVACSKNNNGAKCVRALFDRMANSGQAAWCKTIALELVTAAPHVVKHAEATNLLLHVLCHPVLDDKGVMQALKVCDGAGVRLQDDQLEMLRVARNWQYKGEQAEAAKVPPEPAAPIAPPVVQAQGAPDVVHASAVMDAPIVAAEASSNLGTTTSVPATPTAAKSYGAPPRYRPTLRFF